MFGDGDVARRAEQEKSDKLTVNSTKAHKSLGDVGFGLVDIVLDAKQS